MVEAVALLALSTAMIVPATAVPAAAAPPDLDLTWCGEPAPHLVVSDLLPGSSQSMELRVCNEGRADGTLFVATRGGDGRIRLGVAGSATPGGDDQVVPAGTMPAGHERNVQLSLTVDESADNRSANVVHDLTVTLVLAHTEGTASGGSDGDGRELTVEIDPPPPGSAIGRPGSGDAEPGDVPGESGRPVAAAPDAGRQRPAAPGASLPFTGSSTSVLEAGVALLAAGLALVVAARRRRRS